MKDKETIKWEFTACSFNIKNRWENSQANLSQRMTHQSKWAHSKSPKQNQSYRIVVPHWTSHFKAQFTEIATNFKIFIEQDSKSEAKFKGAWLIDSYEGLYFLELYSERFNFKSIYQIQHISETEIKAISTDNNGQVLVMELSVQ